MLTLLVYLAIGFWVAVRFTRAVATWFADGHDLDSESWAVGAIVGVPAAAIWPLTVPAVVLMRVVIHFAKAGDPPC